MSFIKYNPTWTLDQFLAFDAEGKILKPPSFPEYDPNVDWCGPADQPLLAEMIPERILGVCVKRAGFRHDLGYATGKPFRPKLFRCQYVWRLLCDQRFRADLMALIKRSDLSKADMRLAKRFAKLYYWSVRLGGWKHCER
tara:strand:- start:822 stop:1241 length:420 start_codon:yes stop_codon:yes gene_type:complete